MKLCAFPGGYTIHRFPPGTPVPLEVTQAPFWAMVGTPEEVSVVAPAEIHLAGAVNEPGWRVIQVVGPLDFSLTGILADLAGVLASAGISIFAVSTFNTDYLLVRETAFAGACQVLAAAGHELVPSSPL